MFSKLIFTINDEEIEFNAQELIVIAGQIVNEKLNTLNDNEVTLPDCKTIDKELENKFWDFTNILADNLGNSYGINPNVIFEFLVNVYVDPLRAMVYKNLLDRIKTEEKTHCFEISLEKQIIIPMQLMRMTSISQWLFVSRYLSKNYLNQEHLSGWWFEIGGRVVRLRNDVYEGALVDGNKQFYSSDHGSESEIFTNTKEAILNCIKNFTWSDKGTYFRAFKFWQFFILSGLQDLKIKFIERVSDKDLNNPDACKQLFFKLDQGSLSPEPLPKPNFSDSEIARRESIFRTTLMAKRLLSIPMDVQNWIKIKFITDLPDEVFCYGSSGEKDYMPICDRLLQNCLDAYSGVTPYEQLQEKVKKLRGKAFDKIMKSFLEKHQASLREEFMIYLNNQICLSPEKYLLLLLSLAHPDKNFRGTIDEKKWSERDNWRLGSRGMLSSPGVQKKPGYELTEEEELRYGRIFDGLIEQFRYVTQAIVRQRVEFISDARNPFHTQIKEIMHEKVAANYILTHILIGLARSINHGRHEPLFRELSAYGDREAGNSYHEFEKTIKTYFKKHPSSNDAELAKKMRSILQGDVFTEENLSFLPCLTAAWFISESTRNPLTTMTSLMLLDLIENGIILEEEGCNWYCWQNSLVHPKKEAGIGRVCDLYGQKVNIDKFGGCHPMVHKGSVEQTKDLPAATDRLSIARQKEGHLIIHWLYYRALSLDPKSKEKCQLKKVEAQELTKEEKAETIDLDELIKTRDQKEKNRKKIEGTIRVKKQKIPDTDVNKQVEQIKKLNIEILELENKIKLFTDKHTIKEEIKNQIIIPQLRLRMGDLSNLLSPLPLGEFCHRAQEQAPEKYLAKCAKKEKAHSLNEEDEIPEYIKQESEFFAKQQENIGPRSIPGWTLLDVEDKGNCFYDAVVNQMHLINHDFLLSVPEGTLSRDSLRLHIQGEAFKDREWADTIEIQTLARTFNIVIGIVDTRSSRNEFVYYYANGDGLNNFTRDLNVLPLNKKIIRLAFTGNHYLSVIETSNEAVRRTINSHLSRAVSSFFKKLQEEFIIEHRHESCQLQRAYDKRFGLVLRR